MLSTSTRHAATFGIFFGSSDIAAGHFSQGKNFSLRSLTLERNTQLFSSLGATQNAAVDTESRVPSAAESMAVALRDNVTLGTLNIGATGMDRVSGEEFGKKLDGQKLSLCTLILRENELTDLGVKDLIGKLATNSSLVELDLSQCGLTFFQRLGDVLGSGGKGEQAANIFIVLLAANTTLRSLNLIGNKMTPETLEKLLDQIVKRPVLSTLLFSATLTKRTHPSSLTLVGENVEAPSAVAERDMFHKVSEWKPSCSRVCSHTTLPKGHR